jgi:hypothetical protein
MRPPHTVPRYVIYIFFTLGLISAIAFRAIIILERLEPLWVRHIWYIGVLGYFFFFLYRWKIARKRKHTISEYNLIEKIGSKGQLSKEEKEAVLYLLKSIKSSPEDINYAVIFILSLLAVAIDIALSLR